QENGDAEAKWLSAQPTEGYRTPVARIPGSTTRISTGNRTPSRFSAAPFVASNGRSIGFRPSRGPSSPEEDRPYREGRLKETWSGDDPGSSARRRPWDTRTIRAIGGDPGAT